MLYRVSAKEQSSQLLNEKSAWLSANQHPFSPANNKKNMISKAPIFNNCNKNPKVHKETGKDQTRLRYIAWC